MTAYVDSSALLKRYLDEPDSAVGQHLLDIDPVLATSWITHVEVRRNLSRALSGSTLRSAQAQFARDFDSLAVVACDATVAHAAAEISENLGVRSLDAIHLATAKRLLIDDLAFITFDLRQGQAARSLGLRVYGC
ncbi:MAG TPA: type II toxin-antitoxin system VapC family toxin [Ilumatobacter sp.]|nr:type II toxin-antitoxin system VapC family toxin [Ilumatobacter sp.]